MRFAAWVGATLLLAACSSGGSSGGAPDAAAGSGGTDSGSADAAVDTGPCARFVSCSLKVQPETAAATLAAYGPEGACFQSQSAATCEQACRDGIVALHALDPSEPACAVCVENQDCSAPTPVCNTATGECAQCASSADCGAPTPACDTSTGTCVACVSAADCSVPTPGCDLSSHQCVQCTVGSQCSSGKCDGDHTCCVPDDPCTPSACGPKYDSCGKTVNCGGCAGTEFCSTDGFCEAKSTTFECNAGGTNNTCTKYLQYCQYYFNGPGGTTAWCQPMPAACQANPTCACLASEGEFYPPDTCSPNTGPDGAGALYVTSKP